MEILELWYLQSIGFVLVCLAIHSAVKLKNKWTSTNHYSVQGDPRLYPIEKTEEEMLKTMPPDDHEILLFQSDRMKRKHRQIRW